ncbi:hypothetical protein SEA_JEEVES_35 [Mycobacterium phage Jeeves]|uniref:Uncharacterized protein n=1 Tax=Mycobacterium phage Jeeves TaxID=2652402 RepID=A0A5J6T525_9CAUD|nr:hypothetical protein KNU75_gp074 [Mycobacterium phage Jeeves]QFG04510.1 hypothetical protein SEA_JEEVES_35 [Mycobacterium phage Jeeves]
MFTRLLYPILVLFVAARTWSAVHFDAADYIDIIEQDEV